jgi:hypothetical protein
MNTLFQISKIRGQCYGSVAKGFPHELQTLQRRKPRLQSVLLSLGTPLIHSCCCFNRSHTSQIFCRESLHYSIYTVVSRAKHSIGQYESYKRNTGEMDNRSEEGILSCLYRMDVIRCFFYIILYSSI